MFSLDKIVRKNILDLKGYSSARDEFSDTEGTFLDANENPFGQLNRYPDPYQKALKTELSNQKEISENKIFVGNGSDEVIDLAFRIFCNPDTDKALTFSPTYGMYDVSANINNVQLIKIPLTNRFQIDLVATKKHLNDENLKLIFICSPNNPTGNALEQKNIESILQQFKGIVIVDEAYIDFSSIPSLISLIDKYPNLIVSQTFSKAYGLAAARVGVCYANTKIINLYNKVKPPYNVSKLNQEAALQCLLNTTEYNKNKATILQQKELLKKVLLQINVVKHIYPSDANFLLVKVNNADVVYERLIAQKIIVRNRNNIVSNCIRITIGTPKENKKLIEALAQL